LNGSFNLVIGNVSIGNVLVGNNILPGFVTLTELALQTQRLFGASLVRSLSLHTLSHFPNVLLVDVSLRSQFLPVFSCPCTGLARTFDGDKVKSAAAVPVIANKIFKLIVFIGFSSNALQIT
jgi:hypothetical protein